MVFSIKRAILVLPFIAGGLAFSVQAAPVNIKTLSDDVILTQLPDGGILSSVSGKVAVQHSDATLTVNVVSGDIQIGYVRGNLTANAVSGDLQVDSIQGDANLRTVSGDISVQRDDGNVTVRSASGNVTLSAVASGLFVHTDSGNVEVGLARKRTQARTVEIGTTSGDVVLHLPHDFGGEVELRMKESRDHIDQYRIRQNIGLVTSSGPWSEKMFGPDTRTVFAAGSVGQGSDHVLVHVAQANITVIRD